MTSDWLQRLWWVVSGASDASTEHRLLLISLAACSLFATGQFFTMLSTRWGDSHATAKSFVLSVLLHLTLGLGWATAIKVLPPPPALASDRMDLEPIRVTLTETELASAIPDDGELPVWKQPLSIPAPLRERTARESAIDSESAVPVPQPKPTEQPNFPDVTTVSTAAPEPETKPELTPAELPSVAAAQAAVASDTPPAAEPLARPEAGPTVASARKPLPRMTPSNEEIDAAPARGSAVRSAAQPDELELAIPLPIDEAPTVPQPVGPESNALARKASPVATPLGDTPPGAAAAHTSREAPRFARSTGSRAAFDAANAQPFRPDASALRSAAADRISAAQSSLGFTPGADPQPDAIRPPPSAELPASPAPMGAATTYRLRRIDRRKEIALRNGGSEASEQAVEDALAWLAKHQEAEGYWDAKRHGGGSREVRSIDKDKPAGGTETDTGLTGLAILSFLGAGHTHEEGHYTDHVSRGIRWLIARQRSDGYLGGRATYYDQMYCHGIATYALAEAYGMQTGEAEIPGLREAVSRGVWYIAQTQNTDGGWRYRVGASASDMSIFGWQLMALKSAELAGVEVPDETRRGLINFLRARSRGASGGLAGYKEDSPPTPAMTAEALFCKQMYGLKRSSAASREAIEYLQQHLPRMAQPDEYYWYYGTLGMFQYGGEPWDRWNQSLRDTLIRLQRKSGDVAGSWDPAGPWGSVGGRVYSTTFSVLSLEVYYRFLPLYQVGEE